MLMRVFAFLAALLSTAAAQAATCTVPSYNTFYTIPANHTAAEAFKGKFDYPSTTSEPLPGFLSIDYHADWKAYLWAVLDYAYEGNDNVDFDVTKNTVRGWYHALWMHVGEDGREFFHGLTQERPTRPNQLKENTSTTFFTWAVGYYNSFGATTFAKVYADPCNPAVDNILFPVGTVSFKLLFTSATEQQLPYLAGAPSWQTHTGSGNGPDGRTERSMRLLQVDIAVRDPRDSATGWVFGTFVYNNAVADPDPWRRLRPVGLAWGNDPTIVPGQPLLETVIDLTLQSTLFGWTGREELGWGGRANGPADNLLSSCLSCHGSAQFPRSDNFGNVPPAGAVTDVPKRLADYFRNIKAGEVFDLKTKFFGTSDIVDAASVDYSLQLQRGLENMCSEAKAGRAPFDVAGVPAICLPQQLNAGGAALAPETPENAFELLQSIDFDSLVNTPIR